MRDTHILYHANCMDGLAAAWCVYRFLGLTMETSIGSDGSSDLFSDVFHPYVAFHPVKYGDPLPDIGSEDDLYCVDFCPPPHGVASCLARPGHTTLLDHHKTAVERCVEELPKLPWRDNGQGFTILREDGHHHVAFDLNRSGAVMAWCYLLGGRATSRLWFIDYVQDRDLWQWKLPESKAVSAYMGSFGLDLPTMFPLFDEWERTVKVLPSMEFIEAGRALLRQQEQDVRAIARSVDWWDMPDGAGGVCRIPVVNSCIHISELGHHLVVEHDAPFSATWYDEGAQSHMIKISLRSEDRVDVSKVAKMFGGGGHPNAAGFHIERSLFAKGGFHAAQILRSGL